MTRFFILPYTQHSEGAKAIADAVGGKRLLLSGSEYAYQQGDCIINWGNGDVHLHRAGDVPEGALLNRDVNICINKKTFFQRMQGHNIVPPFAFSKDEALRHLQFPIICRTRLEGADGQGVVVANNADDLVSAKLYTQLMDKTAEYRVHLGRRFDGGIVLIAAQKKRLGAAHGESPIWTGEHVYMDYIEPSELPRHVFDVTKRSMELMPELTFGGFDVIDTAAWGARVVEVNSAPLQTPTTARKYAAFFQEYVADRDIVPEEEIVPTGSTFDTPPSYNLETEVDEVLRKLFNNELRSREVIEGYIHWINRG